MKKIFNIFLIASVLAVSTTYSIAKDKSVTPDLDRLAQKEAKKQTKLSKKAQKEAEKQAEKQGKLAKKNKDDKVHIVEPEEVKVNHKKEIKKRIFTEKSKVKSSKEAEGMYETKFPVINSKIEYADMNGEVSLEDCIKLAITHHPAIMSAISNAEIYKSRIGQAWSNYFPTLTAGVSYSRNDMFNTMGTNFSRMMASKYDMYYVPTVSANMLLFDFGKTKAYADSAKRTYESTRYDAETSIETVIYNVKVAYYNLVFAKIQKSVYEETVQDFELQLKQARAYYDIGKKAKIDVTYAEYNLGNANLNLIKAKNTLELASVELANAVGIPELADVILKDSLNTKLYDVNFPDLIKVAESTRPSLLAAKKRMDAAELNVRSAKKTFTADVSAFV